MPWMQAAVDRPFGFRPYDQVLRTAPYHKDSGASAIYPGDVVIREADGAIGVAAAGSTNIIGVAAEYSAASTEKTDFLIYDHPDQLFMAQDDGDTTHMAETQEGNNCNIVTTTGDTTTFQGLQEIDSSSAATTGTLPLKIVRLHPIEANSYATAAGSPRRWIVKINNHLLAGYQQAGI